MSVIANYLSDNGIDVTICSFLDSRDTYEINQKIKTILIHPKNKITTFKKMERILLLRKVFKENQDASIISFEYFVNLQTLIAALFLKNRVIISERNDPKQLDKRKIMKIARDLLYRLTDVLVCQTPEARKYFTRAIREKAVVIPNPILPNLPEKYIGQRKKEIVNFCRLEPQKNLKMLIDAYHLLYKEHPDYTLTIYGDGSEKEKLINYIRKIGLYKKIKIHGFTSDIHKKINQCAMFASSSNYEGISNSMLEALGMGLPSVVTDCPCGGARMFIKSYENGILVPVGNTHSLYAGMRYLIENPIEAEKISENAVKMAKASAADKINLEWLRLL